MNPHARRDESQEKLFDPHFDLLRILKTSKGLE